MISKKKTDPSSNKKSPYIRKKSSTKLARGYMECIKKSQEEILDMDLSKSKYISRMDKILNTELISNMRETTIANSLYKKIIFNDFILMLISLLSILNGILVVGYI